MPSLRPPGHSASPSTPCRTDQDFSPREVRSAGVEAGSSATEKDAPGAVLVIGLWQDGRVCRVVWVGCHGGKCRGTCTIWRLGERELRPDSLDLQQRPPSLSRIYQIPALSERQHGPSARHQLAPTGDGQLRLPGPDDRRHQQRARPVPLAQDQDGPVQ
jgi:hypothetical protein